MPVLSIQNDGVLPVNVEASYSLEGQSLVRGSAPNCAFAQYRHLKIIGGLADYSEIDGKRLRHSSQSRLKPNGFCVDGNAGT